MIINKHKIYRCSEKGVLDFKDFPLRIQGINKLTEDFYYFEFASFVSNAIDQIVKLENAQFDKIKNPESNLNLLINNYLEAHLDYIDDLYKLLVDRHKIPENKIHLITESHDLKDKVHQYATQKNRPKINVHVMMALESASNQFDIQAKPNKTIPYKRFLCLNSKPRIHRLLFMILLQSGGSLAHSHYSFRRPEDRGRGKISTSQSVKDLALTEAKRIFDKANFEIIKKFINNNLSTLYKGLDQDTRDFDWLADKSQEYAYHRRTGLSIINETYYDNLFFTEKLFRTMIYEHPFLVLGTHDYLYYLRHLGYKTFDGIFDESYDKIKHPGERMQALVAEVNRLSLLSDRDFSKLIEETKPIVEHNVNRLRSQIRARVFYNSTIKD